MNIGDVMMLTALGGALVALGFWMAYLLMPRVPARGPSLAELLAGASHVTEAKDAEPEAEEAEEAALPVDPDNPPFPRVYHRRSGRPPRQCHCHGRELEDNEVVLFWPNPDTEGAFWLVCAPDEMKEQIG